MDFTKLEVWRKAHQMTLKIYKATREFPPEERYRLTDQLCRSAASIRDLGCLSPQAFSELIEGYNEVGRMLNGLIKSLKERDPLG